MTKELNQLAKASLDCGASRNIDLNGFVWKKKKNPTKGANMTTTTMTSLKEKVMMMIRK